jgi:hypothetical protein
VLETLVERRPRGRREVVGLIEDHKVEEVERDRIDALVAVAEDHWRADHNVALTAALPGLGRAAVTDPQDCEARRRVAQRAAGGGLPERRELVRDLVADDPRRRHNEHPPGFEQVRREHGDERLTDARRQHDLRRLVRRRAVRGDGVQRSPCASRRVLVTRVSVSMLKDI